MPRREGHQDTMNSDSCIFRLDPVALCVNSLVESLAIDELVLDVIRCLESRNLYVCGALIDRRHGTDE